MRRTTRRPWPLAPLLHAFLRDGLPSGESLEGVPGLGPRYQAIADAARTLLNATFLDDAKAEEFQAALGHFYERCVPLPLHSKTVRRRAGLIRHGLNHLIHGRETISQKLERFLVPGGPYHVPGLGPAFWSAVAQALDPERNPSWLPAVIEGSKRLGIGEDASPAEPGAFYRRLTNGYARLRTQAPAIRACHGDYFLALVANMHGRDLWAGGVQVGPDVAALVRQERTRVPLRRRLKERRTVLDTARSRLESALANRDGLGLGAALALVDPASHRRSGVNWAEHAEELVRWVGRSWETDQVEEALQDFWRTDPVPGAGLWLPAAVLHLRHADRYFPWDEAARQGYARLDDAVHESDPPWVRYQLFNEGLTWVCHRYRLHPLEVPALLATLARTEADSQEPPLDFGGFCNDTFAFLSDLESHNHKDWMQGQRDRYHFAVREPLVELCRALGERYVGPVLGSEYGWDLETAPRNGKALTSVVKNDYGRSTPYQTELWITFFRRDRVARRDDAQLFVRVSPAGVSCGVRLGREARETSRLFRKNLQVHSELLFQALTATGAVDECRFGDDATSTRLGSPGDLRSWALSRNLVASKELAPDSALLRDENLIGEVLLTFDRLVPVYACAVEADPVPILERKAGLRGPDGSPRGWFTEADFQRATHLGTAWVARARELLELKRQIVLQGVPGTGKTHVARSLARLLTNGRDEAVKLVQFHPSYSYEEFVEGIKVKSVEVNGRHEVTYPVEAGLLCGFAAEASRSPADPFVLVIDEINRGNLPRVFGELLYLLEYRNQAVNLPYSRRAFRLPPNLYLIGTMNAADRSVTLIDQALRRRFSFLDMPPDARVLAEWLTANPPRSDDPDFGFRVVNLFEALNERLRADLGPYQQVGHSFFMVPDLDEGRLEVIWNHHVEPLLAEFFANHPQRTNDYELKNLLRGRPAPRSRRSQVT